MLNPPKQEQKMEFPPTLLNSAEAAPFLKLANSTLAKWRVSEGGPPFIKVGRAVRYDRPDLCD